MGHIILPEGLELWLCPNEKNHKDQDRVFFRSKDKKKKVSYYVVRVVWKTDGQEYHLLDCPMAMALGLFYSMRRDNPTTVVPIFYVNCAKCEGFDFAHIWRKKFRQKPYELE